MEGDIYLAVSVCESKGEKKENFNCRGMFVIPDDSIQYRPNQYSYLKQKFSLM